jgi:hypothetical protein
MRGSKGVLEALTSICWIDYSGDWSFVVSFGSRNSAFDLGSL